MPARAPPELCSGSMPLFFFCFRGSMCLTETVMSLHAASDNISSIERRMIGGIVIERVIGREALDFIRYDS